jgi:hypothetical protein
VQIWTSNLLHSSGFVWFVCFVVNFYCTLFVWFVCFVVNFYCTLRAQRFSCFGERSDLRSAFSGSPRRARLVACSDEEADGFRCGPAALAPTLAFEFFVCRWLAVFAREAVAFIAPA